MTKVTITLSPQQFDRLRGAVEAQQRYHIDQTHNSENDPAIRASHRTRAAEMGLLMETLNRK